MPSREFGLPIGATNVRAVYGGVEYPIDSTNIHTRTGSRGTVPVFLLHMRDLAKGEILEAGWRKGWDAGITTFVCKVDTAGDRIQVSGQAAVGGTYGFGWAYRRADKVILMDGTTLTVKLQAPAAVTAGRNVFLRYVVLLNPSLYNTGDQNWLDINISNENNVYKYSIRKRINGTASNVIAGTVLVNDDVAIKLVFAEEGDGHTHIYIDDGITGTYTEHGSSPFALGLAYQVGVPALEYDIDDATSRTGYLVSEEWTYPDFQLKWSDTDTDYTGGVELWNGDPDAGGVRVYSTDHVFAGDPYIQNGVTRLWVDLDALAGLKHYCWSGAAWIRPCDTGLQIWLIGGSDIKTYPQLLSVSSISPEKVVLNVRLNNTAVHDLDHVVDLELMLERGRYYYEARPTQFIPALQQTPFITNSLGRFGYAGDGAFGDEDVSSTGTNTTMSDNFSTLIDPNGVAAIGFIASKNNKPSSAWQAYIGKYILFSNLIPGEVEETIMLIGAVPFSLIANTFKEAEDATLGGGATAVVDAAASGGQAALLDAQNEYVRFTFNAGTHLPAGRYLGVVRVRDINQVANDFRRRILNLTDSQDRNENNAIVDTVATASYTYYSLVFDITSIDVTGLDAFYIQVTKATANANEIYVDYFLIVPLGDGRDGPQDLAHAALRTSDNRRRVFRR